MYPFLHIHIQRERHVKRDSYDFIYRLGHRWSGATAQKKYPEWRKKLDNDFLVPSLIIEGNEWASIKHYMLGSRFSNLPDLYKKFMKNGEVGTNIDKATKYYIDMVGNKEIEATLIKEDEFKKEESKLLEKALYNKFTQNDEMKQILLFTGDSKINIYKPGRGGGAKAAIELMNVRQLLGK